MSRADDTCRKSGRPLGLTKRDSRMPSALADAFISFAKPSTEPDTPSAIVTAISLADFTISIFKALSSVTSVPGRKPIFEGAMVVARAETFSGVSSVIRPSRTAFSATKTVISLVREAGYQGRVASCCISVSPEAASITITGLAVAGAAPAASAISAAAAVARVRFCRNFAPRGECDEGPPAFLRLRAADEKPQCAKAKRSN